MQSSACTCLYMLAHVCQAAQHEEHLEREHSKISPTWLQALSKLDFPTFGLPMIAT